MSSPVHKNRPIPHRDTVASPARDPRAPVHPRPQLSNWMAPGHRQRSARGPFRVLSVEELRAGVSTSQAARDGGVGSTRFDTDQIDLHATQSYRESNGLRSARPSLRPRQSGHDKRPGRCSGLPPAPRHLCPAQPRCQRADGFLVNTVLDSSIRSTTPFTRPVDVEGHGGQVTCETRSSSSAW